MSAPPTPDPERHQLAKRIFLEVCDLSPAERETALRARCGADDALAADVRSLLQSHDVNAAEGLATSPGGGTPASPVEDDDGETVLNVDRSTAGRERPRTAGTQDGDDRIGPYKLKKVIGRGGMGVVWLAEQERAGVRQEVALKILSTRDDAGRVLARFDRERQILASLKHESIARLYDAGETDDGRPYFVMEYVHGIPIDRYCDEQQLGIEERIDLFCRVCAAVQAAHNAAVVHRDLKPANILVTKDGRPKLLDFGIARYTNPILAGLGDELTIDGLGPMTPEYASPEQVRGDDVVGTESDVYSLGVILYELLSGHRPYRLRARLESEIRKVVLEEEPRRPSAAVDLVETIGPADDPTTETITPETVSRTRKRRPVQLRRRLEGDLDNIVLKALRKEAVRRYATAHAFAEDLQRHLDGMPVTARPDTLGYRAAKFVRRNRVAVGTASVVATTLVVALVVTIIALGQARAARDLARQRFNDTWDLARFLLVDLDRDLRVLIGGQEVRERIAEAATARLGTLRAFAENAEPAVAVDVARGLRVLGEIAGSPRTESAGAFDTALERYDEAFSVLGGIDEGALDARLRTRIAMERAVLHRQVALIRIEQVGEDSTAGDRAADALDAAIALAEPLASPGPLSLPGGRLLMSLWNDRAKLERARGDEDAARRWIEKADELLDRLRAAHPDDADLERDHWHRLRQVEATDLGDQDWNGALAVAREQVAITRARFERDAGNTRSVRELAQSLKSVANAAFWCVRTGRFSGDDRRSVEREGRRAIDEAVHLLEGLTRMNTGVYRDAEALLSSLLLSMQLQSSEPALSTPKERWTTSLAYVHALADLPAEHWPGDAELRAGIGYASYRAKNAIDASAASPLEAWPEFVAALDAIPSVTREDGRPGAAAALRDARIDGRIRWAAALLEERRAAEALPVATAAIDLIDVPAVERASPDPEATRRLAESAALALEAGRPGDPLLSGPAERARQALAALERLSEVEPDGDGDGTEADGRDMLRRRLQDLLDRPTSRGAG